MIDKAKDGVLEGDLELAQLLELLMDVSAFFWLNLS
jgi:hypothetical protein